MLPQLALIAAATLGIDVGWEPLTDGGVVYIIQIEPDQISRLKNSDDLLSDMPKDLDVRQVRITIGTGKLPRTVGTHATAKPALGEKELIAEGSIPAKQPKEVQASAATANGPQRIAPADAKADPAAAAAGGTTGPEETTAMRPYDDGYASRNPEPRDEEQLQNAPARQPYEERPVRDELFATPPSRPLTSRPLEDRREVPATQPSRLRDSVPSAPVERYIREPEADYEAAKPTLPSSFRTADSGTRLTSAADDRDARSSDAAWGPVVAIFFFLLLSMGANMWLAWIAWEARQRYQVLLDKYRAIGGKPAMELV